jgi:hydrogenase-4 component F
MGLVMILYVLCGSGEKTAVLALLLHIGAHSLTKTVLFHTAGNLLLAFGSRAVSVVQGIGVAMKGHAVLWICALLLICAMPPSVLFFTELSIVANAPLWVAAVVLSLLFMVFAAMMKTGLTMVMGSPVARHEPLPKRLAAVPFVLLVLLAVPALAVCVGLVVGLVPEGGWL